MPFLAQKPQNRNSLRASSGRQTLLRVVDNYVSNAIFNTLSTNSRPESLLPLKRLETGEFFQQLQAFCETMSVNFHATIAIGCKIRNSPTHPKEEGMWGWNVEILTCALLVVHSGRFMANRITPAPFVVNVAAAQIEARLAMTRAFDDEFGCNERETYRARLRAFFLSRESMYHPVNISAGCVCNHPK